MGNTRTEEFLRCTRSSWRSNDSSARDDRAAPLLALINVNHRATRAFIVSQGEELLTGQTVDTNANYLAAQLTGLGLRVFGTITAGDRAEEIAAALRLAVNQSDVVVCTGGLGPTSDDLTAEGFVAAFGGELVLHKEALDQIKQRYADRNRTMVACNEKQAMLPVGAGLLPNPLGTAPGFAVTTPAGARIFCLPGVPHEMRRMWTEEVRPRLEGELELQVPQRHLFRTIGKGESQLQELIGFLPTEFPGVRLGFRARSPENQVKLDADADCASFQTAVQRCRELLGRDAFSEDEELSLAAAVGALLQARGERLALAESCTGGWIGHLCVTEPGSSAWFERGAITYSNRAKVAMIEVSEETLERHGAVSEQVALEMARGTAKAANVDWGLAVTGVAGPSGGSPEKPVGTIHLAVVGPKTERAQRLFLPTGSRTITRKFTSYIALDLLRRQLLRLGG